MVTCLSLYQISWALLFLFYLERLRDFWDIIFPDFIYFFYKILACFAGPYPGGAGQVGQHWRRDLGQGEQPVHNKICYMAKNKHFLLIDKFFVFFLNLYPLLNKLPFPPPPSHTHIPAAYYREHCSHIVTCSVLTYCHLLSAHTMSLAQCSHIVTCSVLTYCNFLSSHILSLAQCSHIVTC